MSGRDCARIALALLLIMGLAVRLYGVDWGFPSLIDGDERPVCKNAVRFLVLGTLEPEHFNYPELYSYLFAGALTLYYMAGGLWQLGDAGSSAGFTWFFRPTEIALVGRLLSVLFGTATVAITWLVGRRAFGDQVAVGAALFAAFSTLLVHHARLALPDVAMTFFVLVACYFLLGLVLRRDWNSYLLAGLFIGLAVSTKYNAGMAVCGLLASHLVSLRGRISPGAILDTRLVASGAAIVIGFVAGSPYWTIHYDHYLHALVYEQANMQFSLGARGQWLWPTLVGLVHREMAWGLLGLAGCAFSLYRRNASDWVILSVILPTLFYVGTWPKSGLHYVVFLFPLLGVLGARAILDVGWRKTRWSAAGLALVTLPNIWSGIASGHLHQDVRLDAARWIEANIPNGAVIGVYNYDHAPPLKTADIEKNILYEMLEKQKRNPTVLAGLKELEAQSRFYRWVDLEYSLDQLEIPPQYEGKVDPTNPKTRSIFSRDYLGYEEMKQHGVRYVVLPAAAYARFFDDDLAPAPATAEHYHYWRNRTYISSILSSAGKFEVIGEFGSMSTEKISVYRLGGESDDRPSEEL